MDSQEERNVEPEFSNPGRLGRLKEQMYSRFKQPVTHPRRELSGLSRPTPTDWVKEKEVKDTETEPQVAEPVIRHRVSAGMLQKYSWQILFLIVSIVIFITAGSFALIFLVSGFNTITSSKIDVSVNGPRTIEGGDMLSLQISVRNNNSATLELSDLLITYPSGTREPSDISASLEAQRVSLGTIEPGGVRNGVVRAVLFGRVDEIKDVTVEVEYRLQGSNGLFSTEPVTYSVTLTSSALDISLDTNTQVVAGQRVDMTATITSNAKKVMRDVVLSASYPFGFSLESTNPDVSKSGLWRLGDLEPGDTRTIRITGMMDGQTGDTRIFRFIAGTQKTSTSNTVDVVLADFEHEVKVERPFLGMSLEYGGKTAEEFVGETGELVSINLEWINNLDVALSDVVIAATLGGSALDPFNIIVDRGFYRSIDSFVIWDKSTTEGALAQVAPGESGVVSMRLTPLEASRLLSVEDPTITFELHAAGQRLSETDVPESIRSSVRESIKIGTDVVLKGRALYFDNPLGSVGSLPPKVESETTYGILWEVSNTTNRIRDGKVTAILPPYVRWVGAVSPAAESVTFNENDRTVTWYAGNILPNTGVGSTPPRRVVFSVGLVPSTSQVGTTPDLILNHALTGVDVFTDRAVESRIGNLNINLQEANFVDFYGVVAR